MALLESEARKRIGIQFSMLARSWRRAVEVALLRSGLSDATWMPLVHLHETGGGLTQKQLAARLGIDASTLVRLLDILEGQGLLERRPHEHDGRIRLVSLTKSGLARVEQIRSLLWETELKILQDLEDEEVALLLRAMARIEQRLAEGEQ